MSRGPQGDVIAVKPTANIYTVLTFVALVAVGLTLYMVMKRAAVLSGDDSLMSLLH